MLLQVHNSRAEIVLIAACFVLYAFGFYLTRAFICQPVGAWLLLGGVAVGALGWLMLSASAIRRRSLGLGFGAIAIALILAVMFFFIGVLTLPGCSGV
ncbi:hypothetical protein [Rudaea cellulosilytica]|jgi:hypothetical protein|uniref:hypothetical protein n=1 Tax=Rudaea cellulosilytica TaxID=540746 RepID=UPI0012F9FA39|nr:hypothetical protein [Rudaea cellulosilytica]